MVLNYIWVAFFIIAFIVGLIRLIFFGDTEIFPLMMNGTFDMAKTGFEISLGLTGVMTLWMGLMKVGETGGCGTFIPAAFSRDSERSSGHWLHDDEYCSQYAWA